MQAGPLGLGRDPLGWFGGRTGIFCLASYLILGLAAILLAGFTAGSGDGIYVRLGRGILGAGGSLITLGIVGTLFGTASHLRVEQVGGDTTWQMAARELKLFADWFTKALVGAAVAVIALAPSLISRVGEFFSIGSADDLEGRRLGALIALYFGSGGLIAGYLLARARMLAWQRSPLLEEGLRLALTLPLDRARWKSLTMEQNRAIEAVAQTPRFELRSDTELRAWARMQLALRDPDQALQTYEELAKEGRDPTAKQEIEEVRRLLQPKLLQPSAGTPAVGPLSPSFSDNSIGARVTIDLPQAPVTGELSPSTQSSSSSAVLPAAPQLLPSEVISEMFKALYEPAPAGFSRAIELGLVYSGSIQSGALWAYFACAYGQKHAFLKQTRKDPRHVAEAADRALFCVQQVLDIDPGWRAQLRGFWNPNSPGDIDNDLVSLHGDVRFAALLEPEGAARQADVMAGVRAAMIGNAGARYDGSIEAWLAAIDGTRLISTKGVFTAKAGSSLRLVAQFRPAGDNVEGSIGIRLDGEQQALIDFMLRPDSVDIDFFTPDSLFVTVSERELSRQPDFSFAVPESPGSYDISLYVTQAGRTATLVRIRIDAFK